MSFPCSQEVQILRGKKNNTKTSVTEQALYGTFPSPSFVAASSLLTSHIVLVGVVDLLDATVAEGQLPHPVDPTVHA